MSNREMLADAGYEESIVLENPDYDNAIIGVTVDGQVLYDYYKMIDHLVENDGMTEEEAADHISYDTMRRLSYSAEENKPIIMYSLEDIV